MLTYVQNNTINFKCKVNVGKLGKDIIMSSLQQLNNK